MKFMMIHTANRKGDIMKTVEMLRTKVCVNVAGVRQVFGPAGKRFIDLDNHVADELIKDGAAFDVKNESEVTAADAESE